MNDILKKLGMNYKEFSTHYEIPYNTVRQWAQGTRKPPNYVIKLLNEKIEKDSKSEQIEIFEKKYYLHYINYGLTYVYENIEEAKKWQSFSKNITKASITEIKEITVKEEKVIMTAENN